MRRSIFKAGVVTVFGLAIAFAFVSANSSMRHATTAAKVADAVVATPASSDECTSSDVCCAKETKVVKATVAAAPRAKAPKTTPAATTPAFSSGQVVAIDPESGELGMPSPAQMSELMVPGELNYSDVGLVDVHHPNGMVSRSLQGRFQETATVTRGVDGKLIFGCGSHADVPTPTQAAPPALEEK